MKGSKSSLSGDKKCLKSRFNCPKSAEKCSLQTLFLLLIGGAAGFASGFFGAGGGVILMLGGTLFEKERNTSDSLAEVCTVTALLAAVSAVGYHLRGALSVTGRLYIFIPAAVGGVVGATLLKRLGTRLLKTVFGAVSLLGGLVMIIF